MNEYVPILQLMQARGVGSRTLGRTLAKLVEEGRTPEELVAAPVEELTHFGLKPEVAKVLATGRGQAEQLADELDRLGVQILVRGRPDYPASLNRVLGNQAPPVLFRAGNPALIERKAVAFCGARDASEEGLRLTNIIARRLAEMGVNIVSGHANGVDLTAHCGALAAGGTTALVLAEGILRFKPKPGLAELLADHDHDFTVISEFPPRLPWSVGNAMQRNATVCGLADVVLVMEAGHTGGTFAAGQKALELRRPLFVVAFQQPPESAGGNAILLRKGGKPLCSEPGSEPDLAGVLRALERNAPPAGLDKSSIASPVVQGQLFEDSEIAD